eukprot:5447777-Amphidinium_carterae.1
MHPADSSGLEVVSCGVSNRRLQEWANTAFTSTDSPVIHICSGKGACKFAADSCAAVHTQRWRLWNPLTVKERGFCEACRLESLWKPLSEAFQTMQDRMGHLRVFSPTVSLSSNAGKVHCSAGGLA